MPHISDDVLIVGDGPAGLQCALLTAKNGLGTRVVGLGESPVSLAVLFNHLGLDGVSGPNFLEVARQHAEHYGVHLHRVRAVRAERAREGFRVVDEAGNVFDGRYLVLAAGKDHTLAQQLGLTLGPDGIVADLWGRTSVDKVYAGGRAIRGHRSQVATSVGDGAAIALDILMRERGKPVHDWDTLEAATPKTSPPKPGKAA
jgi:thioredoxin reductase (NADPH)